MKLVPRLTKKLVEKETFEPSVILVKHEGKNRGASGPGRLKFKGRVIRGEYPHLTSVSRVPARYDDKDVILL